MSDEGLVPINLADAFGSLTLRLTGYAYSYEKHYLRGTVTIQTRHLSGKFEADLEGPDLAAFGAQCAELVQAHAQGRGAEPIAFVPRVEKYLNLAVSVPREKRVRWKIACQPSPVSAERLEFEITTELAALEAVAQGLTLVARRWPTEAPREGSPQPLHHNKKK